VVGVGIDLVDVGRVERMLERYGGRVVEKLLTDAEACYVQSMPRPALHLAARIAAKEAAFKALQGLSGAQSVGWQELEVIRGPGGRPGMALRGRAAVLDREHGPLEIHVSLTHADRTAGAVALVLRARGGTPAVPPSNS
jgi:holo-[acyl-carrier protein] synthase